MGEQSIVPVVCCIWSKTVWRFNGNEASRPPKLLLLTHNRRHGGSTAISSNANRLTWNICGKRCGKRGGYAATELGGTCQ